MLVAYVIPDHAKWVQIAMARDAYLLKTKALNIEVGNSNDCYPKGYIFIVVPLPKLWLIQISLMYFDLFYRRVLPWEKRKSEVMISLM